MIPDPWTKAEIEALLLRADLNDLQLIPLAITNRGTPDLLWSESICLALSRHADAGVRGNAILGLGHLARTMGTLTRERSVPAISAALLDSDGYVRDHADSAASDVEHFLHWRVPPWDDLFARWRRARATRSSDLRTVADIALRRIRNLSAEDLAWFESSLEDADRRWFVTALYRNDPLPRRLFDPMMRASLRDTDASDVQEFVRPCCETFGSGRVDAWLTRAAAAGLADSEAITKARYKAAPTARKRGARKS